MSESIEATIDTGSTELIPSISIVTVLQRRKEILDKYDTIEESVRELKRLYFPSISHPSIGWKYSSSYPNEFADAYADKHRIEFAKIVDKMGWDFLMRESGNLQLMDAKAKDEWQQNLDDYKFPELTFANIQATFKDLHSKRGQMFDRGVVNCFERLIPEHKRNDDFKFTKRMSVSCMDSYYSNGGALVLDDLVRCCRVLDGKPELAEYRQTIRGQIQSQYSATYPYVIENPYFKIVCYKNNNGHVTWRDEQMLEQMNRILARAYPAHIAAQRFANEQNAA